MSLLNYTSKIPSERSIAEISRLLARGGARQVMQDYDDAGNTVAISFSLDLNGKLLSFRLPNEFQAVRQILQHGKPSGGMKIEYYRSEEHAQNVSWRVIKDWIEAQMALIEIHVVTTAQVFLPYATTATGQSLYEYIGQHTNLLLGEGN